MGSLEGNKAFAAVLIAGIAFVGSGLVADALVHPKPLHETAIKVEGVEVAAAPGAAAPAAPAAPISVLLASADAGAGEGAAKRLCVSCHSFEEGGKNGVGPNLYAVMGAPHGRLENYQYSAVLKGKEGPWGYEEMSAWLLNPRGYATGTKMAFAGISNDKQRADVILYLRSLAKEPLPLPEAGATPAAASGTAPSPAPGTDAAATPRSQQSTPDAPMDGGTRTQGGQVTGPPGQGQVQGQQNTQPSPSMNQSQAETNNSQQPPQARQVSPGAPLEGVSEGGSRTQQGQVVGPAGQGQVQGQQNTQPSASQNQSQAETNNSQQPAQAQQVQ